MALLKEEVESGNVFDLKKYPSESPRTVHTGAIPQAIRYIENHIGRKLTIDQVARWVGLSRTIFITRFREKTGKSFKQFQTDLRLDKAKVLLTETTLSIDQISTQVGLTPGQLRQLFHLKYGCSPRAFRKANKNVQ